MQNRDTICYQRHCYTSWLLVGTFGSKNIRFKAIYSVLSFQHRAYTVLSSIYLSIPRFFYAWNSPPKLCMHILFPLSQFHATHTTTQRTCMKCNKIVSIRLSNVMDRSRNIYTSSAILSARYHFTGREHFYCVLMSPATIKST